MKSFVRAVAVAALLAAPVASFAQSNQPVTRAQVRSDLMQLEKAGYNPGGDHNDYPADIQAAEARVHGEGGTSGFGGVESGSSASGTRAGLHLTAFHLSAIHPADRGGRIPVSAGHH
jgi:opacity protein-like surface antigen